MKKLLLLLVTIVLSGCVTEFWDEMTPGAYNQPPTTTHDVYRVGVVDCDGTYFTVIAVEMPFGTHVSNGHWYIVPLDVDLRPICQ